MPVLINPVLRTLERTPQRAIKFLSGSRRNLEIDAMLKSVGFDAEARREGWRRLHAIDSPVDRGPVVIFDPRVVAALQGLDRFDDHCLPIVDVTLRYNHPEAHDTVFAGGLAAAQGDASVLVSRKLVDRVEALAPAPRALLEKRGLTAAKIQEAREWLALVEGVHLADAMLHGVEEAAAAEVDGADDDADDLEAGDPGPVDRAWYQAALALWQWLDEWTTIARKVIRRRDQLIQLGLARRKAPTRLPPPA